MTRLRIQALSTITHTALIWLALAAACWAQTPFNPGDSSTPTPKAAQPVPLNPVDWKTILFPAQCPDGTPAALNTCGDGRDGYGWIYDSFTQRMELRPPKILFGPGSITANAGLTQNAWNNLYGAIGSHGYRPGLVAYIPRGSYVGSNTITIASGTVTPSTVTVRVLMGTCLAHPAPDLQPGILIVPTATTNAITAAGNPVLHFSGSGTSVTTCIVPGMVAYDVTHPAVIPAGIMVSSTTATSATLNGNAAGAGVANGDTIEFGFPIGYAVNSWAGGAAVAWQTSYFYSSSTACLAADRSNQQCEILTEVYTNDSGSSILAAGGQVTLPPYSSSFNVMRMDGGYGAQ